MKNKLYTFIGILLILTSCSTETKQANATVAKKTEQIIKVNSNATLSVNVEGMVCEMGCGSAIRKALKETNAVEQCSFDFKDERKVNTATISYDSTAISKEKILSVINTLNEKQFKATL